MDSPSPKPSEQSKSTRQLVHEYEAIDLAILDDEFRAAAEEDTARGYWFFLQEVLGYKDLDEDLHGRVCHQLTDGATGHNHLLLLPRGHLKSAVVTIGWSMWRVIQNQERTITLFNETTDLVEQFLGEIREHLEHNEVLKKHWGHIVPPKKDRRVWRTDALKVKRKLISRTPTFEAKSIIESTAGRHPDAMVLDDVISDRTVGSADGIKKSLSRFRELRALLEPPDPKKDKVKGTKIVIGTRWHYQDLYWTIISTLKKYYQIMIRRCRENGRVIFPQKFNEEVLEEWLDEMKEWVFSAQMMNEPVDSENAVFTPSLMKKSAWHGSRTQFLQETVTHTIMAIDPAFEGEDEFGICVGCVDALGVKRTLETRSVQNRVELCLKTCLALVIKWKVHKVFFEAVGGQEWLRRELVGMAKKAGLKIQILPAGHGNRPKETRIIGLTAELNYGRLKWHISDDDFRTEALHYPRTADDRLDAVEIFSTNASKPSLRIPEDDAARTPGTGSYEIQQIIESQVHTGGLRLPWETGRVYIDH